MTEILLLGNPNSGKSTLFNYLSGSLQKVGNYSGVTVNLKNSKIPNSNLTITDLPGVYNIENSTSPDEQVTIDHLSKTEGIIINVIDSSNLERSLHLTLQLIKTGRPVVIALNMMDRATKRGVTIDPNKLSEHLGCPVFQIVASRGFGVENLLKKVEGLANLETTANKHISLTPKKIALKSLHKTSLFKRSISDKIDDILLNKYAGLPIFLLIMFCMFSISIGIGNYLQQIVAFFADTILVSWPRIFLENLNAPDFLIFIICDCLGSGISLVLQFAPVIGTLYLVLSLLEESGYISRAAFLLDRLMNSIGMSGKSFLPLVTGFGCNVPSVIATRIIDNPQERIMAAIMMPFMSCGARLSVYALFCAAFFPKNGALIVFSLYILGIIAAVFTAVILKILFHKNLTTSFFALELPCYNFPQISSVFRKSYLKMKNFVVEAGKIVVAMFIILNLATSFDFNLNVTNKGNENSVLAVTAKTITPAFKPMGIDENNWPAVVGIIAGIFAKEAVIGSLGSLYLNKDYGIEEEVEDDLSTTEHEARIYNSMQSHFKNNFAAFSYLIFILLYFPCIAVFAAMAREFSYKLAVISMTWSTLLAYTCATVFFQASVIWG